MTLGYFSKVVARRETIYTDCLLCWGGSLAKSLIELEISLLYNSTDCYLDLVKAARESSLALSTGASLLASKIAD
jgi:hypothetical protein